MKTKTILKNSIPLIVSDSGRIWKDDYTASDGRKIKRKEVGPNINSSGYKSVAIHGDGKIKKILFHRIVAECFLDDFNPHMEVDHIDGNKLNNSAENLRMLTHAQNSKAFRKANKQSSSIFRGVSDHPSSKKWRARLYVNGRHIHLGYYDDEIEAAKAFNFHAIRNGYLPEALNNI